MKLPGTFQVKFQWSRARALLIAVALIASTNAVVLAGVAYNRSGEPEAVLQLTERELHLRIWRWPEHENSSIDLHLSWRVARADEPDQYGYWYQDLHWLQSAQLQELGFDVSGNMESDQDSRRVARQPSRRAWLVLEYDGPAYQAALERARSNLQRATSLARVNAGDAEFQRRLESAERRLTQEQRSDSRLFVVDAGLDADALREQYPDRRHYVVVRGRLGVTIQGHEGRRRPVGRVAGIDVDAIRVPYRYRDIVEPLSPGSERRYLERQAPRFAATVNFGQRFEPWIVDLQPMQPGQP